MTAGTRSTIVRAPTNAQAAELGVNPAEEGARRERRESRAPHLSGSRLTLNDVVDIEVFDRG